MKTPTQKPPQSDADELKQLDAKPEPITGALNPVNLSTIPLDKIYSAVSKAAEETIQQLAPQKAHPTQSLGDLYAAIESSPAEWLPSLLAKVVRRSLKSKAWSDVEHLILSVKGFAK